MRKILLFTISLLIGIGLLVWIYQSIGLKGVFAKFSFFKGWQIFVLFLFTFIKILIWTWRWQLILQGLGCTKLPFKDLASLRLGEMSISYLTPGVYWGGEIVRVVGLKKKKNIPLSKGATSVILDRLFDMTGFCFFIFVGLLILLFSKNFVLAFVLLIFGLIAFLFLFIIFKVIGIERMLSFFVRVFRLEKIRYIRQRKHKIKGIGREATLFFKKSPVRTAVITVIAGLGFLISVYQLMFFLMVLGEAFSFYSSMVIKTSLLFGGIVPIPGNLGIFESISVLAFQGFKFSAETGLSFSLMMRLIDFSFIALGIFVLLYYSTGYIFNFLGKNNYDNK